jgi:hypothetical protein
MSVCRYRPSWRRSTTRAAGLAGEDQLVVKRGLNDATSSISRAFRGTGHILRFIEYMDVGTLNGWRMDDVVPMREMSPCQCRLADRARRGEHFGEVAERWRCGRRRRNRRDRLRDAAILRQLHACAQPTVASIPACSASSATTFGSCCAKAAATRSRRGP